MRKNQGVIGKYLKLYLHLSEPEIPINVEAIITK
jgi:hypothetical protein